MAKSRSALNFDILLVFSTIALMIIGILFIYSSGVSTSGSMVSDEYTRQIIWVTIGVFLLFSMTLFNYNILKDFSFYLYLLFLFLLILTLFFGKVVNGSKSWFGFWGLGIQPSEFCKIATIIFLAKFLSDNRSKVKQLPTFTLAFLIVLIPMGLIVRQPDLGTALVFLPIFFFMMFMAGAKARHIFFLLSICVLTMLFTIIPAYQERIAKDTDSIWVFLTNFFLFGVMLGSLAIVILLSWWGYLKFKRLSFYWIVYGSTIFAMSLLVSFFLRLALKEYQIMRLIVFLDPSIDPKGSGWNLIQSLTAVGSGGFFGKGFLQGTQSHYRFLPMQSTDFIFSILAEEWGFIGGMIVFSLFSVIIIRFLNIMNTTKDNFAIFTLAGFIGMFCTHVFVNIGMTMGIMPITGIPLYFLSYGGSSMMAGVIAVGIGMSVHYRRFMF